MSEHHLITAGPVDATFGTLLRKTDLEYILEYLQRAVPWPSAFSVTDNQVSMSSSSHAPARTTLKLPLFVQKDHIQ
jgi:hypothetical protein